MLKTLAIIGVVVVVAIAGILLYAATRPDSFRVQRVVLINAPSDKGFPLINDIKAWTAWRPACGPKRSLRTDRSKPRHFLLQRHSCWACNGIPNGPMRTIPSAGPSSPALGHRCDRGSRFTTS